MGAAVVGLKFQPLPLSYEALRACPAYSPLRSPPCATSYRGLKPWQGPHRSHTVLPSAGLRDDALLAQALAQQRLTQRVVNLVCTGVVKVLAL